MTTHTYVTYVIISVQETNQLKYSRAAIIWKILHAKSTNKTKSETVHPQHEISGWKINKLEQMEQKDVKHKTKGYLFKKHHLEIRKIIKYWK